jgi:hypothetical protein
MEKGICQEGALGQGFQIQPQTTTRTACEQTSRTKGEKQEEF